MPALPDKLAFVDIETTGGSLVHDRVIEVGIIRVEKNRVVDTYETLINPEVGIPPEIQRLTGITPQHLESSPTFSSVRRDIHERLNDCIFVAHNARFDYGFLRQEFKRDGTQFKYKQLCTCKLSRHLFPRFKRHNLDAIIERFGFLCENRHRALGDAEVLWQFYQKICDSFESEKLIEICSKVLRRPSVPLNLNTKILDDLPENPGVYIFYGDLGMPLYIGKSVNIRDRVLSHFSGDLESTFEMKIAQQVKSIETIETVGELGALLTESHLIKKLQPLYNKKLRHAYELLVLRKCETKAGYSTVEVEQSKGIDPQATDVIVGVFRSKRQMTEALVGIAKEHQLCQKLLGVEKGIGACFGYGLGWCKGACVGKEKPIFYNVRFIEAFGKHKISRWPFSGPVVITEKSLDGNEGYIIDNWCYGGKIEQKNGTEYIDTKPSAITFDYDVYKILRQFFKKAENLKHVRVLNSSGHRNGKINSCTNML